MSEKIEVTVKGDVIRLGQFLKLANIASTGGEAKMRVQNGEVKVNGQIELRRGLQLREGDHVETEGDIFVVIYDKD